MNSHPLMQCGHTAQAKDGNGKPMCAICFGIHLGYNLPAEVAPDLTTRTARCTYFGGGGKKGGNYGTCGRGETCQCEQASSTDLPFFEYRPQAAFDAFYCGCWGWD